MGTTMNHGSGGWVALDEIAETLVDLTLSRRDVLPRRLNGKTPEPSNTRAKNVRHEMAGGRSHEWLRIMTLDLCDLNDGVPIELVLAAHYRAIALLKAAVPKKPAVRPLDAVQVGEMKGEHALNLVQRALDKNPECPKAHEAVIRECDRYVPKVIALRATCEDRLVSMGAR